MSDSIKQSVKSIIEKFNLFVFLQILWIVEYHFLALLSIRRVLEYILNVKIKEPSLIAEFCGKITNWMSEYNIYTLYLSIMFLIVGLSGWCFIHTFLRKYNIIIMYSDFGIYAGSWLLLIFSTYKIYILFDGWFLLAPLVLLIVNKIIDYLKEKIREKINL